MRLTSRVLVALVGLAASACATQTPMPFSPSTSLGTLSLASSKPGFNDPMNARHVWRDLDRLATGVWSNAGDSLQINVSVAVSGEGSVYLRALVDDQVAQPSDIMLFLAGSATSSERSFTFIAPNVAQGFHLVRVQWLSGDSYTAQGRSLAVRSVPRTMELSTAQLQYAVPQSGPDVHIGRESGGRWSTIPGLSTTVATRRKTDMQITFAAELGVESTRFVARALVDGATAVPGDITMVQEDQRSHGTRSMTFTVNGVPAGTHTVAIEWYSDPGGDIWVGDRTLSVYAVDASGSVPDGSISSFHNEGPPETVIATDWRTNWAGAVDTGSTAASGVTVSFSLEHLQSSGDGDVRVRAVRPDGTVFDPPEYVLDKELAFNTQTMLFATKDFPTAGLQFYEIQYKVDDGVTAQFRDYSIASGAVRRTGADFAQAQPYQNNLHPHQSTFDVLTICLDPLRPGEPAITDDTVMRFIDGSDSGISVRELLSEMSGQRWRLGAHTILGCGTPKFYQPPVEHQGSWYWDNDAFDVMRKDAITAADVDFDFASFDLDGDKTINSDELHINICIPQTSAYGAARGGVFQVDGTTLAMRVIDCYFGPNSSRRPAVGINAHEAAHWMLNAYDLYGPDIPPMPDDLSLMGTALPIHLSAYEKLHYGWIMASVLDIAQWNPPPAPSDVALPQSASQTVKIDPIETAYWALLIYDPTRSSDEYFLIEHRSKSSDLGITNYDRYLSVTVPAGPVLWHIVENPALLNPSIPPPVPCRPAWPRATSGCVDPALWAERLTEYGWIAGGIQNWGSIVPQQAIPLVWSDGTPVNITVSGVSGDSSLVRISKKFLPLPVEQP